MVNSVEIFIETSYSANSVSVLLDLYLQAVEREGYQNAMFARARDRRLVSIPWNRLPVGYLDSYKALEWDKIDPVLQHIHSARRPFSWTELCSRTPLTQRQHVFLEKSRELGVHSGVTIPLHGPGTEMDLISLSLRDEKASPNEKLGEIYAISAQYWLRFGELTDTARKPVPNLTLKELECLRWCKEGKTNWEIGEILATSEKTVEFHLSNTIRKLGACNRITAVVSGIQNGLISL
jgi:DNA-binding CsgD family transcriptional regulator